MHVLWNGCRHHIHLTIALRASVSEHSGRQIVSTEIVLAEKLSEGSLLEMLYCELSDGIEFEFVVLSSSKRQVGQIGPSSSLRVQEHLEHRFCEAITTAGRYKCIQVSGTGVRHSSASAGRHGIRDMEWWYPAQPNIPSPSIQKFQFTARQNYAIYSLIECHKLLPGLSHDVFANHGPV